jgi:hypothetical protein
MKYFNVYNGIGKMAIKAFDNKHALRLYCSHNGMLSIPDKYYAIEISEEEFNNAYYKIA